jgi:hypothetical protein
MSSVKETVKQAQQAESPKQHSFDNAIDIGDMSQVGIKLADNACLSIYNAFNQRMEANLGAMRSRLMSTAILIPAEQKALPATGSFFDTLFKDCELEVMEIDDGKI